jgi:tRNA-dihydrouridine synthase B
VLEHYEAMLSHYGTDTGLRVARKHLGWYCKGFAGAAELRGRLMTLGDPAAVRAALCEAWSALIGRAAPAAEAA